MSDFALEETTFEHIHHIQDLLDGTSLIRTQPPYTASMNAVCSSSINPAILDLSRGIEQDLEPADTGHSLEESESSLSDDFSGVDECAGLEVECNSSENENAACTIDERRLTIRTQSRVHVPEKDAGAGE
jgi:hypothetical protein